MAWRVSRVVEAAGISPLLQETMDVAVAIMAADMGTMQLLDGDSLRIVAHRGHEKPFLDFFAKAENVSSACGEATRRRERVLVPDVDTSPIAPEDVADATAYRVQMNGRSVLSA